MYTLYGIKNCDNVKAARAWLDRQKRAYHFHDYREDGLSAELLADFVKRVGWDVLLNRHSSSWRQLSEEQRCDLTADKAMQLMLEMPTLIKRPVLDTGGQLIVGFDDMIYTMNV